MTLGDKAWLSVGIPVHPKGVGWPVKFFNTKVGKAILYGAGFVYGSTVMLQQEWNKHKTGDTNLEAHYCHSTYAVSCLDQTRKKDQRDEST